MKLFSSAGEQIFNLQSYFTAEQLPGRLQFRVEGEKFSGNDGFLAISFSFSVNYRLRLLVGYLFVASGRRSVMPARVTLKAHFCH